MDIGLYKIRKTSCQEQLRILHTFLEQKYGKNENNTARILNYAPKFTRAVIDLIINFN